MPRSSRHKSHKQHKHSSRDGRNYSDSEEGEGAKEVKAKEEPAARSGGRVSREPDSGEKRKAKDLVGPGNGVHSGEHGSSKRRKEGSEPAVGSDRWDGREGVRGGGLVDSEKTQKSKASVDGKGRSSRRQEGAGDRKDEILTPPVDVGERKKDGSKVDFDRKAERDSSRKDSYDHKDGKEKERGGDREKKAQDGRRSDKSVDGALGGESEHIRRKDSYISEDSRDSKREVENSGELTDYDTFFLVENTVGLPFAKYQCSVIL